MKFLVASAVVPMPKVEAPEIDSRPGLEADVVNRQVGMGRELFAVFREHSQSAEQGAGIFTVADA